MKAAETKRRTNTPANQTRRNQELVFCWVRSIHCWKGGEGAGSKQKPRPIQEWRFLSMENQDFHQINAFLLQKRILSKTTKNACPIRTGLNRSKTKNDTKLFSPHKRFYLFIEEEKTLAAYALVSCRKNAFYQRKRSPCGIRTGLNT